MLANGVGLNNQECNNFYTSSLTLFINLLTNQDIHSLSAMEVGRIRKFFFRRPSDSLFDRLTHFLTV